MSGEIATVEGWREIGRSEFGRQFDAGLVMVVAIAERHEVSGEIRLRVEVPNAQIFALPRDLVPLVQVMLWATAVLAFEHKVMVSDPAYSGQFGDFAIWKDCCSILNSLDPWVRHAKHDV